MVEIFLRTLPFFGIIGLGYWAGRIRFFSYIDHEFHGIHDIDDLHFVLPGAEKWNGTV